MNTLVSSGCSSIKSYIVINIDNDQYRKNNRDNNFWNIAQPLVQKADKVMCILNLSFALLLTLELLGVCVCVRVRVRVCRKVKPVLLLSW